MAGRHAEGVPGVDLGGEHHTMATHRQDSPDLKGTVAVTLSTRAYTFLTIILAYNKL